MGSTQVVEVEAGHHDLFAGGGQRLRHLDQTPIEELGLIDTDYPGTILHRSEQGPRVVDRLSGD